MGTHALNSYLTKCLLTFFVKILFFKIFMINEILG